MKNHLQHFVILLLIFFVSACMPSVSGEGDLVKQSREVEGFQKIELNLTARVTVIIADTTSVVVVAQPNLQEYIDTKNEGETLVIRSSRSLKATKPIEIVMTCPAQEALTINGSGDIFIINPFKIEKLNLDINGSGEIHAHINTRKIVTNINGSGDVFLKGNAEMHAAEINGSGKIKAEELEVEKYQIQINGSGDADIHATSKLSVKLTGTGNITYSGQPAIESEIIGSGELKKNNN
ncbi:MAG: DUF2807 domain-containing protein [Bacteroidetes bacterium]|nr:DUF2807 domain-containing protein [Bacteroidota bacterium]